MVSTIWFIEKYVSDREVIFSEATVIQRTEFLINKNIFLLYLTAGLMYIWGVSLNSISMINLVMAIGFAVDYSAHVAPAFVFSCESSPEEKLINALSTVG